MPDVRASKNPRWSRKKMLSTGGYVKVRVGPLHPLADSKGYAYEHEVVWVAAGNPRPPKGFLLHHRNEDREDNRLENLELITRSEHSRLHIRERARDERGRLMKRQAKRVRRRLMRRAS